MTKLPRDWRLALLLAGVSLAVAGCNAAKPEPAIAQAAVTTVFVDVSASTAFIASPSYAQAAIQRVGGGVLRQQLGDKFRIVAMGSRTTDRAVDELSISSERRFRLPAVRRRVEGRLNELLSRSRHGGGDGMTNILYTLENARPNCTPRSKVILLSDGLEDSDAYVAARALAAGNAVNLPPPTAPYLKGCAVEVIGIGISPTVRDGKAMQTLPNGQLQALKAGWRDYLIAAGVRPSDISFTTIL